MPKAKKGKAKKLAARPLFVARNIDHPLFSNMSAVEAGPDTSPLSQLNLSSGVPVTTQLISLIHSEMLKLS